MKQVTSTAPSSIVRESNKTFEGHNIKPPVVAGIGEIVWDMLPDGPQLGGAPLNFASHAALAGAQSHIISAIGKDNLGIKTEEFINEMDLVNTDCLQKNDKPTGKVNVTLDASGVPQYDIEIDSAWDNIAASEEAAAIIEKADCICWGSLAQRSEISRKSILELVSKAGIKCLKIFDINLRQNWWSKEIIEKSLEYADILKLNEDEEVIVTDLFNCKTDALIGKFNLKYIILTKGADCSLVFGQEGLISEIKTPKCDVVDTVGAGDSFTAAFVTAIFYGRTIREAHQIAVETAANVCGHKGAI